jgi:hypothetical protein
MYQYRCASIFSILWLSFFIFQHSLLHFSRLCYLQFENHSFSEVNFLNGGQTLVPLSDTSAMARRHRGMTATEIASQIYDEEEEEFPVSGSDGICSCYTS